MIDTLDRDPRSGRATVPRQVLKSLEPNDLIDPGIVPQGYDTVAHWWATKEAEALDLLRDPLGTFYRDAEELQTMCEERGVKFYWVKAGPAYQAIGLEEVRAYSLGMLAEFYPANP